MFNRYIFQWKTNDIYKVSITFGNELEYNNNGYNDILFQSHSKYI